MSVDYIVSSLPALSFDAPPPLSWADFASRAGAAAMERPAAWIDLETQLRNALAEARGGSTFVRSANGCSLYWKNRVLAAFQERDVLKRENALDRVWWEAAGELTLPSDPLGPGALQTYAVRLQIALRRSRISREAGNAAFDRLTAGTKVDFGGKEDDNNR